jgi:hypothetical protein
MAQVAPILEGRSTGDLADLRFKALLSEADWAALPEATRRRFSKRLAGGATAIYVGEVVEVETSLIGRVLAVLAQVIGGPLPLVWTAGSPSVVSVTEDVATGGQVWTRMYARPDGFPQVIHSAKRFAGPTRLEEYLGRGVGMALVVSVEDAALVFRNDHYFISCLGLRLRLPRWCEPGRLTITHADLGEGRFTFTLDLTHLRFGRLMRQHAVFREQHP